MKEYLLFNFSDFTIYLGVMQGLKIIEENFGQNRNVVDDLLNIAKVICFPIYEILVRLYFFVHACRFCNIHTTMLINVSDSKGNACN